LSRPQFSDPKVRTAMTLALRRAEIVEKVLSGLGTVISGPFLPETGNLDPDVDPLTFDPARAKRLLSEAGWQDTDSDGVLDKLVNGVKTPFEFSLLIYANRPEVSALANIYKDDLLALGIRMKIESAEWALMQKRMDERNFDAFTGGWSLPWQNDPYQTWHSSQADAPKGSNRVGFRNKEVDALIEELRTTFDQAKRQQMYRRIHRLIYEAQPYTFFYRRSLPYCASQDVRGLTFAKIRPLADSRPWFVSESL
jgi:peptide/nickel transport system substrate-binding protein